MREIVERYQKIHKSGLNLQYFERFADFQDSFKQTSMFKEKKLAILPNILSDPDFKKNFLKNKSNLLKSEDLILIYEEGKINKSDSLFKFLKDKAKSQEFELLTNQRLKNWVKKEFKKYGSIIELKAIEVLIEYVGNDLWRMSNEIKKLASYKNKVGSEDIDLLVRPRIEIDVFKTIDAIAEKNKKQALILLHKHLEKGDSPLYLLSMINYQFRNLLVIKDLIEKHNPYNLILKKSGLHPFVVKKSYYQSQEFTLQELKKIYQKIFQVDLDIKTGKVEPETALDLLIAEI